MAFDVGDTLDRIHSYIEESGHVRGGTQIGDYSTPPDTSAGPAGFVTMSGTSVVGITVGGQPIEVQVVLITLMIDAKRDPSSDVERLLGAATTNIQAELLGEYDLGATIRNVDVAGQHGSPMATRWGYIFIEKFGFRSVEISVPLIIDWSDAAAA